MATLIESEGEWGLWGELGEYSTSFGSNTCLYAEAGARLANPPMTSNGDRSGLKNYY
ncbi:hypothetical protein H6G93_05415 [Nostoc sp. FACHB-973]|nr:hypothetical protein [Nostoc sp. FACHB-973]MBX9255325.1 hypothetical protein [Desmonostoc muscorum CCALA 125]